MFLEQLVAGALLKFDGEIDSNDIIILSNLINEKIINADFKIINKYFELKNNKYKFKEGYDFNTVLDNNYTIKDVLNSIQSNAKAFLDSLDLKAFVLRKIQFIDNIRKENISSSFTKKEMDIFMELLALGLVNIRWIPTGSIYDDYEAVTLSKQGEVYLFINEYKVQIEMFKNKLREHGYNDELIEKYLLTKNLNDKMSQLLSVENFRLFGEVYDLDVTLRLGK